MLSAAKPVLLRLHRWITLVFCLPLAALVVTGLILSFEPIVATVSIAPRSLDAQAIEVVLAAVDPEGKARSLAFKPYENRLSVGGIGPDGVLHLDARTGRRLDADGFLSGLFGASRRLHERLILDLDWLVVASTFAMLTLIGLGLLMGWPRLRMSVSGWHQGLAWFALPLVILSPLTGLFIAYGITFAGSPGGSGARGANIPIREAVQVIARGHDLSNLVWLRSRGGRLLVRLNEGGEYRVYAVTGEGLVPTPRNWPRLIHEGNWAGIWSGLFNLVTSLVLGGLLATGLTIWARRRFRKRNPRPRRQVTAPA
jgi:uncharacterized iron-regulated membrane protein